MNNATVEIYRRKSKTKSYSWRMVINGRKFAMAAEGDGFPSIGNAKRAFKQLVLRIQEDAFDIVDTTKNEPEAENE